MRLTGILMHLSCLPNKYGFGSFGKEAKQFIDFLVETKQSYWQILPLGQTSYGDSPYQCFSAFAGNPYLIDLDILNEQGLIDETMLQHCLINSKLIDYSFLYKTRNEILHQAFENFKKDKDYETFIKDNKYWINDYATFMAIKDANDGASWQEWSIELKTRDKDALDKFHSEHIKEESYYLFIQYLFTKQYQDFIDYAHSKGIKIIGDIPIYVALDSADAWSHPEIFLLNKDRTPSFVAGCPPDGFSPKGQLWGNVLYDWDKLLETNFEWWIDRVRYSQSLYDRLRIDHFIGFENYYSIPYGSVDAVIGKWNKAKGLEFFKVLKEKLPNLDIIAENLGVITPDVVKLLNYCQFPGMKVAHFSFFSQDDYPCNAVTNEIFYTSTHDSETTRQWYQGLDKVLKERVDYILNITRASNPVDSLIKVVLGSCCETTIIPIQDYLGLSKEGRMNVPATLGNNWQWRLKEKDINEKLINKIKKLTLSFNRYPLPKVIEEPVEPVKTI